MKVNGKVTHTNRQCYINREAGKDPAAGKPRNKRKSRKDGKEKEESASDLGEASPKQQKSSKFPMHTENLIVNLATRSA